MVRGGPFFWLHWLTLYAFFAGLAVGGLLAALDPVLLAVGLPAWLVVVVVLGARARLVLDGEGVLVDNGWYRRRLEWPAVDRFTRQSLPAGGAGRGWDDCLAVWARESAAGWPILATMRGYRFERVVDAVSKARPQTVLMRPEAVNRGWRPGSFPRRAHGSAPGRRRRHPRARH